MHKILFVVASLIITLSAKAQTSNLIGRWKFKELYNTAKDAEIAKKVFEDFSINLKLDKRYNIILMAQNEGVWSYNPITKKNKTG